MRRKKSCWSASSLLLPLLLVGSVAWASGPDTTRWELRVNRFLVLEGSTAEPNAVDLAVLRRTDVLHLRFLATDTTTLKHVVELMDDKGLLVRRFQFERALTGGDFAMPVLALLERRGMLAGRYTLTYQNSRGQRLELAQLRIRGTN